MKKYKELAKSPIEVTISITDCKWKILIINKLLSGKMRFVELKKSVTGITQKVLTAKLRELEQDGILARHVYQGRPLRVEYSLTDVGYSLRSVIDSMTDWGKDYKKYVKIREKHSF